MPLSKKRDKERKRLAKLNSNLTEPSGANSNLIQPKTDALQSTRRPVKEESNTVVPVESKADRLERARAILDNPVIPKIEDVKLRPELYRAGKRYAPGTEVRDIKGNVFIAPELDAGGQPIHEAW